MTTHRGERDLINSFRDAMANAGLVTQDKIEPTDGSDRPARFHIDGDPKRSKNGWYVLYLDGVPAGEFGCWKRGVQATWCGKDSATMTPADRKAADDRIAAARKQREAAERQRHAEAAKAAQAAWEAATPCNDNEHAYLQRKGVAAHGLRLGSWQKADDAGHVWLDVPDALLVPIHDRRGAIVNLQAIFAAKHPKLDRDKDFFADAKKRGCYFRIGKHQADQPVVICEGYATGASIHQATGWCVVVAFDAGNLVPVAELIREAAPNASIVIAADNDQWTGPTPDNPHAIDNPGVHYANRAGAAVRARVVAPQFASLDGRPTDFNDLHQREGIDAVRNQLAPPVPATAPAADNDNTPAVQQPRNVDYYTPLPFFSGKGKPKSTWENLAEICDRLGIVIRYNVISKEEEILIPGLTSTVDNQANASVAHIISECAKFDMPTGNVDGFVTYLADQNPFNPVTTWIQSKPWDKRSRLADLYATITAKDEHVNPRAKWLKETLMRRWLVSAAAAAFQPHGVSAHGVLVLQGDQYLGKTKWFKSLVPADLGVLKDGMILRPDDKDSVKQACSFWLVELGELDATFRKSDIAALKSFITNQSDVLRRAYARKESHFARRTVFFGSVNPHAFLHDPTGNRRYWSIACQAIDHSHSIDMQQLWAEVAELYASGETWYLEPEEMAALNDSNETFTASDPIEERLQTKLDWESSQAFWDWKTATDVLLGLGIDRPTRGDAMTASQHLRKMNGGQSRRYAGKNQLYVPGIKTC